MQQQQQAPPKVILVAYRLPLTISVDENDKFQKLVFTPAVGSITAALGSLTESRDVLWVGDSGLASHTDTSQEYGELLREQGMISIDLSEDERRHCYGGFCNGTLWPHFHYFTQYSERQYNESHWQAYCDVNLRYAKVIGELVRSTGCRTIWIHDFQFLLLPAMLREEIGPDLMIGLFLHVPFPSYETFRILPWRKRLLESMLAADLIGLQTTEYLQHLLASVEHLIGDSEPEGNVVHFRGHTTTTGVFPMPIDYARVANATSTPKSFLDQLRHGGQRKIIASVALMDYVKAIPIRLQAFGRLLDEYPEYREKVVFLLTTISFKDDARFSSELKERIYTLIGSINGKYTTFNWEPIKYINQLLPRDEILAILSEADVCLVTPYRDGMNLVCKEYVAAKNATADGVLILSEFAGAAEEMTDALLVNPHDEHDLVNKLKKALEMNLDDRVARMRKLQRIQSHQSVHTWADSFLWELSESFKVNLLVRSLLSDKTWHESLRSQFKRSSHLVLALGRCSLYRHGKGPLIHPSALWEAINRVSKRKPTILISYESCNSIDKWFAAKQSDNNDGCSQLSVYAEGGLFRRATKNGRWKRMSIEPVDATWKCKVLPMYKDAVRSAPSTAITENEISVCWDYNPLGRSGGRMKADELGYRLSILSAKYKLSVQHAFCVLQTVKRVDAGPSPPGPLDKSVTSAFVMCDQLSKGVLTSLKGRCSGDFIAIRPFRTCDTKQVAVIDLPNLLDTLQVESA